MEDSNQLVNSNIYINVSFNERILRDLVGRSNKIFQGRKGPKENGQKRFEKLYYNMADVREKTINGVNNDTVINTTKSVDEEEVVQFILSTMEEQKVQKKRYVPE